MFCYKNHRLHVNRISFQIPDGFFIDSDPDGAGDDFIKLWAPFEKYAVDLWLRIKCNGAEAEMEKSISDTDLTMIKNPEPVSVNGVPGYYAIYQTRDTQYYELWLDLAPGVAFCILIIADKNIEAIDIDALLKEFDFRMIGW